jgi:uncharacterized protein
VALRRWNILLEAGTLQPSRCRRRLMAGPIALAVLACWVLGLQAATPSFLCSKAKTWLEKTICASERLSELDLELALVYARLLRLTAGETEKRLTAEQNRWWASRNDCRRKPDPVGCLDSLYTARIAALRARPDYTEARPSQIELPPERIAAVGEGWSKSLGKYLKAIRTCLRKTPAPAKAVMVAWDDATRDNAVGVRMQGPNDQIWMCVASRNGLELYSLREANSYEDLPEPGPIFYPDPSAAPADACGKPVQILDENDAPAGWLGPACAAKVARPEEPAGDPEAAPQAR